MRRGYFRVLAAALNFGTSVVLRQNAPRASSASFCLLFLSRLVLASSMSLALPQAAGLVHSAARPLQNANAGAGLHFGSIRQKEALRTRGAYCLSTTEVPKLSAAASTRQSPFRIRLRAACMDTTLSNDSRCHARTQVNRLPRKT